MMFVLIQFMGLYMKTTTIKTSFLAASLFVSCAANATLVGSDITLDTIYQQTGLDAETLIGVSATETVRDPGVEFPSLGDLSIPDRSSSLVDVSIDAGNDFVAIDFDNAVQGSQFSTGYFNGYILTFEEDVAENLTGAAVDSDVTTLELSDSDIELSGNQLSINVAGLYFDTSTYARIDLQSDATAQPQPVPLPAGVWLLGSGLLGLMGVKRLRKAK